MKLSIFSGAISIALLSAPAFADITIKAGSGVRLLAHNGQQVSTTELAVKDGEQQVLVSYLVDLSKKIDQSDIVKSDTWVLRFDAADTTVTIAAPSLRTRGQFNSFNQYGNWQIKNAGGSAIEFDKYRLKKEGFQFARNYEQELSEFNQGLHAAALKTKVSEPVSNYKSAEVVTDSSPKSSVPMAEKMLRYWYQNADRNTQLRFRDWLNSQP